MTCSFRRLLSAAGPHCPTCSASTVVSSATPTRLLFLSRPPLWNHMRSFHVSAQRLASNENFSLGKDVDVVRKPIDIQVAEAKDSQIYTMQDFIEKQENEERALKHLGQRLSDARDNPIWTLWALGFVSLGVITVVVSIRIRKEQLRFDPRLRAVKVFDQEGGPSIGGPFSLVDVNGKRWTNEDFKGKWLYIYFGFTNCPDICPEEMSKMSRLIKHMDKKVGKDYWQPLFISLDPKRDTPAKVKEYLMDFSPRILGLTGTLEEVEQAARQYRVYFAVPDEQAMSESDYLVDHSIIMYLMDPEGKFCDYTTKEFQWFESYSKLLRRMTDYEKKKAGAGDASVNLKVAHASSVYDETGASRIDINAVREAQPASAVGSFRRG